MKIGLKQEEEKEGIVVDALFDSGATRLVISEEFTRKQRFRRIKLERPIYMRNVDGILNYVEPMVDTVEVEIFFKEHKKRMLIDVIGGQKWNIILSMLWLACHNPEIDWRMEEVQMMRCPEECGKKWRIGKQMKSRWQKQKEKKERGEEFRRPMIDKKIAIARIGKQMKSRWQKQKEKKERGEEFRRPMIDKKIAIARIVEKKEEDLIELRTVEKMVPRQFHKYLKVFKKKESERMPMKKAWNHAIDLREGFVPKKGKIYLLSRVEREKVQEFVKNQLRKRYIRPSKLPQTLLVFFVPKKDGKKRMVQDYRYLNSWTIKNNYPLPLISDLINSIGKKKVFTKMDL